MILDLFSHKLHSSTNDWPEKLAELAAIFGEFDGQLFDRNAFENRLQLISPRVSYFAHDASSAVNGTAGARVDASKYRDEISAYPAYLGLYYLEASERGWIVRVSETAKRFLLREDPDVGSFLRLQLPLFQYPSAMGAVYTSFTNKVHVQANARNRSLELIRDGIHLSPVRLIALALKADAALRGISLSKAAITFREVYGLANAASVNRNALPDETVVSEALESVRNGTLETPAEFERRFHTLRHTEIFSVRRGSIQLRESVNEADKRQLYDQIDAILRISNQFRGFDNCTTKRELSEAIATGAWGRYFDGVQVLESSVVEVLTNDRALTLAQSAAIGETAINTVPVVSGQHAPDLATDLYPFRERSDVPMPIGPYNRRRELADPEVTRIKMQRRNLTHKELIDKMDKWLRRLGARPTENDHIDLFAKIPHDGSFIFEMKSGGESLLEQIRKGLSQLYEYRFRYSATLAEEDISLCLVLPESPRRIPWIIDYLVDDRDINLCWFDGDGNLAWPPGCSPRLDVLIAEARQADNRV